MAQSGDSSSRPTGRPNRRPWFERHPRLALAVTLVLVLVPPMVLGVAGSWGLAALEQEPEQFHEAANRVAGELNRRARSLILKIPLAVPGAETTLLHNPDADQNQTLRVLTDDEAKRIQREYLTSAESIAKAALTFRARDVGGNRRPAMVSSVAPVPDPQYSSPELHSMLLAAYRDLRAGMASSGFHTVLGRTSGQGRDWVVYLQSVNTQDWDQPNVAWVAWIIDLPAMHARLQQWAQELRLTGTRLPVEFTIRHWSAPDPEGKGLRFALLLDRDVLPAWRLWVSVDTSRLPIDRVDWRSLFYAIFAILAVPGAFLALMALAYRMRRSLAEARNKVDFVANVTHELRTPLTSIRMFTETLLSGRMRSQEDRDEALGIILQETERLERLISRVLEFNKLERQTKIFSFEATDFGEIVRGAVRVFLAGEVGTRHPRIDVELEGDLAGIECDRDAMREVILNLLSNAEKYAGVELPVTVRAKTDRRYVWLEVIDRGPGIPLEEQGKIFDKFYRANDTLNRRVEGTGLGLAICRHIVRAHRGTITVSSHPGEGAVFAVRFPVRHDMPAGVSGRFNPAPRT